MFKAIGYYLFLALWWVFVGIGAVIMAVPLALMLSFLYIKAKV